MNRNNAHSILDHPGPIPFAHRGGAALFPENTLPAFQAAFALGCRVLELDLRCTKDGHLVVLHDESVDRTTSGRGPVSALTLKALQRLDAAYHRKERGSGITVPTFEQVVRALPDAAFNVELKDAGGSEPLQTLIRRYDLENRLLVASREHERLERFRRATRLRVPTAASAREAIAFRALVALGECVAQPRYRALQLPVRSLGLPILTRKSIQLAHLAGIQVHAWTIDRPEQMQILLELGVDGIMTDRPDLLLRLLPRAMPHAEAR